MYPHLSPIQLIRAVCTSPKWALLLSLICKGLQHRVHLGVARGAGDSNGSCQLQWLSCKEAPRTRLWVHLTGTRQSAVPTWPSICMSPLQPWLPQTSWPRIAHIYPTSSSLLHDTHTVGETSGSPWYFGRMPFLALPLECPRPFIFLCQPDCPSASGCSHGLTNGITSRYSPGGCAISTSLEGRAWCSHVYIFTDTLSSPIIGIVGSVQ